MERPSQEVIARLPLAEAVLLIWAWVLETEWLEEVWDRHRGRCYDRILTFPVMVQLIADALLVYESGRESFQKHIDEGFVDISVQAAYRKLGRLPIPLSQAFLTEVTARLREVFPDAMQWQPPAALRKYRIVIYDGKAIKRVAKRLKPLRGASGGLLGGRALVALDWSTGLAIAMHGDPDGDANDVKYVQDLVPVVNRQLPGPRLHVSDRGFCDLQQPRHFTAEPGDHFLVRHHPKVQFHRDPSRSERLSVNDAGQPIREDWGWLGGAQAKGRRFVRRIELERPDGEPVVLITDLLDTDEAPAGDLLFIYRERWEIERLFQKVTEVFDLRHLIGGTPNASLFQFAFCMVLYNLIQVVRGYVADAQDREPTEISTELLFRDVERQLTAWNLVLTPPERAAPFAEPPTLPHVRRRLRQLLSAAWSATWLASPRQTPHRTTPRQRSRSHGSVYRLIHGPPSRKRRRASQRE
jgi:hypothetical protein